MGAGEENILTDLTHNNPFYNPLHVVGAEIAANVNPKVEFTTTKKNQ